MKKLYSKMKTKKKYKYKTKQKKKRSKNKNQKMISTRIKNRNNLEGKVFKQVSSKLNIFVIKKKECKKCHFQAKMIKIQKMSNRLYWQHQKMNIWMEVKAWISSLTHLMIESFNQSSKITFKIKSKVNLNLLNVHKNQCH